jgi:hypothetical protein
MILTLRSEKKERESMWEKDSPRNETSSSPNLLSMGLEGKVKPF